MTIEGNDPFPLGAPVNRGPEPSFVPIKNRPGWHRHERTGQEIYIEPKPPEPIDEHDLIWPYVSDEE